MIVAACRTRSSLSGDEGMACLRAMRQTFRSRPAAGARHGMLHGMLHGALYVAAIVLTTGQAVATPISGSDVSRLIVERLASEGLEGAPVVSADRVFPACGTTLDIEPMFGGWTTVAVTCEGQSGWRFAIRTNLSSRPAPVPVRDFRPGTSLQGAIERAVGSSAQGVMDEIEVVALARSVSRNEMIGAGDLVMIAVPERNALGAFFDPADVAGRRMKTSVSARQPLMARHLHPDYLVEEGGEVLISSSAGGISVDMVGYALENGQIGEWIGVENASSGKTVRAKVTGEKKVAVIAKK